MFSFGVFPGSFSKQLLLRTFFRLFMVGRDTKQNVKVQIMNIHEPSRRLNKIKDFMIKMKKIKK
jgi:hypothetical protein